LAQGLPVSTTRFEVGFGYGEGTVFCYPDEYLINAAVGVALHALGYCHKAILPLQASRPILNPSTPEGLKQIELLRSNVTVARHLVRDRKDLSPLVKMILVGQSEYPDGTGWPPTGSKITVHELVRLFQIVDFYDTWTNPYLSRSAFSREDVLSHIWSHSTYFPEGKAPFPSEMPFDRGLLEEFLNILGPYELGEKIYLYPWDDLSVPHFVGRVYQYHKSYVPFVSVPRDEKAGKDYPFGKMILDIAGSTVYHMENKHIVKKTELGWISKLRLHDTSISPADLNQFWDHLFG